MRKIILFMHVSLDGFTAGTQGEMDWIHVDDEMFDFASKMTDQSDTALYGRKTYEMMNAYWPTAAGQPNASKHDIEHSKWYNEVLKIVISETMGKTVPVNTQIISNHLEENIIALKNKPGKHILIFGSPTTFHSLFKLGLVDDLWLFVNPVIIGQGIPLFKNLDARVKLTLIESKQYSSGVIRLHYVTLVNNIESFN